MPSPRQESGVLVFACLLSLYRLNCLCDPKTAGVEHGNLVGEFGVLPPVADYESHQVVDVSQAADDVGLKSDI